MSAAADPGEALGTVDRFVARINAHDLDGLVALMTPDHRLIDSLGAVIEGREPVRAAWQGYFGMVPDYTLSITRRFSGGNETVLLGTAGGSLPVAGPRGEDTTWSTPVAIRAAVQGDRLSEWQVFADNEPIRQHLRRADLPRGPA